MGTVVDETVAAAVDVDELDMLIEKVSKRGYEWHMFRRDRHGPEVLAGVRKWRTCADVVVLLDERTAHAYRTPIASDVDVFVPIHVHWWYGSTERSMTRIDVRWVFRAVLTLPNPDEPGGLGALRLAPSDTGVPGNRIPVQVRSWLGR